MSLKITLKPIKNNPPYINVGNNIKVTDLESGIDISNYVHSIDIKIRKDEWVTAVIECDVGELELIGVDVEEIKNIAKNNYKDEEYYGFKDEDDYHRHTCNYAVEQKVKERENKKGK